MDPTKRVSFFYLTKEAKPASETMFQSKSESVGNVQQIGQSGKLFLALASTVILILYCLMTLGVLSLCHNQLTAKLLLVLASTLILGSESHSL
jgi:hypothetical protein